MCVRVCVACSIGYAIAERLARDGAMVMVSSRKEGNVASAVERLREGLENQAAVQGVVCHVGKEEHRKRLLQEVRFLPRIPWHISLLSPLPPLSLSLPPSPSLSLSL